MTAVHGVHVQCGCERGRNIPVRIFAAAAALVRAGATLDPNTPVASYWCWRCKTTVVLTARDLYLAA